jgi:hypothetical protein
METKYYIYHIPTYVWKDGKLGKVGTTEKLKARINENLKTSQLHFDFWEVLEEHTDIMEASRREIELQKQYGYKVDKVPYWKTKLIGTKETRSKGGKVGVESGHLASIRTKESCSKGGAIGGRIAAESGHLASICGMGGKLNRKLTFEDAQMIRELYSKKQYNQPQLAELYSVSRPSISNIINNKRYLKP